jgi:Ca2+-transporting ATPase
LHITPDGEIQAVGDPTELSLLVAAAQRGLHREKLLEHTPEFAEIPFDSATNLMATLHKNKTEDLVAVKGAPESVILRCSSVRTINGEKPLTDQDKQTWLDRARNLGDRGLRTLSIATKSAKNAEQDPHRNLVLLGIVGLADPSRTGVKDAIDRCRNAGIEVIMVTGDHLATARSIADELGIVENTVNSGNFINGGDLDRIFEQPGTEALSEARVFARVTPEQKLNLINYYQQQGYVVAMTGDGVNDAPALKKADIGIAMGLRGTAVAKEASHMVLQDDEFGTIIEAVAQGRAIYQNIRNFVVYLLSCNISELLVVSLATIAGAPLPLLPLQILFLNLVTDVFPALALGVGEGSPSLMKDKPRPADEPLLTRSHWLRIGLHGVVMSAAVLGAMSIAFFYLKFDKERAVTVSFCTLAFAQLWHVFNMRNNIWHFIFNEITRNIWIWYSILLCFMLVLFAIYTPLLSNLLELTDPGIEGWIVISFMSLMPILFAPLVHLATERLSAARP